MSKHTPEPWFTDETFIGSSASDQLNSGYFTADCLGPDAAANARRIVACVNACAGIGTETLEDVAGKDLFSKACDAMTQRDELIEALERTINASAVSMSHSEYVTVLDEANAVLIKAKGGAE